MAGFEVLQPPLRIRLTEQPGEDRFDGGWWPHTRDLTRELAALVDGFPSGLGAIVRVLYSPGDWERAPERVPMTCGYVRPGTRPDEDAHVVVLSTTDRRRLSLVVVPPSFTAAQGAEALLAAASPGNRDGATALLDLAERQ